MLRGIVYLSETWEGAEALATSGTGWSRAHEQRSGESMAGPMSVSPRPGDMPELTLEEAGFTRVEIERLRRLRETYPYIEYVDSRRQWHRLRFVKWLYHQGQLEN